MRIVIAHDIVCSPGALTEVLQRHAGVGAQRRARQPRVRHGVVLHEALRLRRRARRRRGRLSKFTAAFFSHANIRTTTRNYPCLASNV